MKKLLGLFCVMILIFVVAGPAGAKGNRDKNYKVKKFKVDKYHRKFNKDNQQQILKVGNQRGDGNNHAPEPTTIILLGSGLVGLAVYGRKKFKK